MCIEKNKEWGDILDWTCGFDDEKLIEQIRILEHIIDCNIAKDCVLFGAVLDLYNHLRNECVNRISERISESM